MQASRAQKVQRLPFKRQLLLIDNNTKLSGKWLTWLVCDMRRVRLYSAIESPSRVLSIRHPHASMVFSDSLIGHR